MRDRSDPSFDEAFEGLFGKAFRLAYRILGSAAAAEDVAAEALARAFADWKSLRDRPHRDAWVLRVASNLAIDATRRKTPAPVPDAEVPLEDVVAMRVALVETLNALPRRQREAVVLRHLGGLPEAEIAEALGVTHGTVKTHLQRGMAALRMRLGVSGGGLDAGA